MGGQLPRRESDSQTPKAASFSFARAFQAAIIAFLLGIFVGSSVPSLGIVLPLFLCFVAIAIAGLFQTRTSLYGAGVFCFLALGILLGAEAQARWDHARDPIEVSGVADIVRKPESREYAHIASVRLVSCSSHQCPEELIEVRFPLLSSIEYGERGSFTCTLEPPDEEWRMWHAARGIGYRCRDPEWERIGSTRPVRRALLSVSSRFEDAIMRHLPEPESGLAAGLLLGGDRRLPETVREEFRDAGLTHIVAVSGFNISIIAEYFLIIGIVLTLPRRRAAIFSLMATGAFVFIAGAPPSAVRALGMAGTLMLAHWLGRRYESLWALLFVAAVMLVGNPLLLRHDVGFQLSFLATAGIVLSMPIIARVIRNVPKLLAPFFEAFMLTIAANLLLIPVLLSVFGKFVPTAIPANTALLPFVPLSMLLSFLVGLFGMFSSALGTIAAFPAYAALHVIIEGARLSAHLGDTAIETEHLGWWIGVLWYGVLAWIFYRLRRSHRSDEGIKKSQSRDRGISR